MVAIKELDLQTGSDVIKYRQYMDNEEVIKKVQYIIIVRPFSFSFSSILRLILCCCELLWHHSIVIQL